MMDEPTLPSLPSGSIPHPFLSLSRPSKRVRLHESSPPVSSDPPLFSSDDDPSAENYSGPRSRQKRKYRGPWFKQEPADLISQPGSRKRTLQRQFDSAVWLGSDGTDIDEDDGKAAPLVLQQPPARPSWPSHSKPASQEILTPEMLAQRYIDDCLECGVETIDLSFRALSELSNTAIRPLASFAPIPSFSQGSSYQNLVPNLKIFLSSNSLTRVPGEIFNLENLVVLSLRNNELEELPGAIGKLDRLHELNVSNNRLRYLPYELLDLLQCPTELRMLHIHPNPFFQAHIPDEDRESPLLSVSYGDEERTESHGRGDGIINVSTDHNHGKMHEEWILQYKCRSHIRFLDIDGRLLKGPVLSKDPHWSPLKSSSLHPLASETEVVKGWDIPVAPTNDMPEAPKNRSSMAPSLYELAAKTWARTPNMPEIQDWLGDSAVPAKLPNILRNARMLRESEGGDRKCTICSREFVIPRTEWIEWWEFSNGWSDMPPRFHGLNGFETQDQAESMIPFMRRGCSWKCLPPKGTLRRAL